MTELRPRRKPGRKLKWTDQRLEAALRAYIGDRQDFPTGAELERAGRHDLCNAIKRRGVPYWAERLEIPLKTRQNRVPITEAEAREELVTLLNEHGYIGQQRITDLGHSRLATFVNRHGGTKKSCRYLGIESAAPHS